MSSGELGTTVTRPTTPVPLSTFFCADGADVVIRAAGTRDFHAHKSILSLVSPVFKDMFALPQPPTDSPPHIDVEESEETWENILRTIYPMPNPVIDNLGSLESLLLAAKKYEMQPIIDIHKKSLENRAFVQEAPLHLYAIACACGLDDQVEYVARNADLLTVIRHSKGGDLKGLTVASYLRLITFLAEKDNELRLILEQGWMTFGSGCGCVGGREWLYHETMKKLRAPYTHKEEVYLKALEGSSSYRRDGCSRWDCPLADSGIKGFVERMFGERERLNNRFTWKE